MKRQRGTDLEPSGLASDGTLIAVDGYMTKRRGTGLVGAGLIIGLFTLSCGGHSSKSNSDGADIGGRSNSQAGTGGTANAQAGSAPDHSAGGQSPERCVNGEACSSEGDVCTDDSGCCVIRDVCLNGRWTQDEFLGPCKTDPPALPFECSSEPPVEGTACGPCHLECPYDTCSPQGGQDLIVQCVDGKWNHVDLGCLKCCKSDSDCPDGVCAQSRCLFDPGVGCFGDSQCPTGQVCAGAQIAACGTARSWEDQPGVCLAEELGCCRTNDDCKASEVCLAGVCKPPAPAGRCWTNQDCGPIGCGTTTVCPCGSSCAAPDAPGHCLVAL